MGHTAAGVSCGLILAGSALILIHFTVNMARKCRNPTWCSLDSPLNTGHCSLKLLTSNGEENEKRKQHQMYQYCLTTVI